MAPAYFVSGLKLVSDRVNGYANEEVCIHDNKLKLIIMLNFI